MTDRRCVYCMCIVPDGKGIIVIPAKLDQNTGAVITPRQVACARCRPQGVSYASGGERVIRSTKAFS